MPGRGLRTCVRGHVFPSRTPGRHIHHCQGLPAQAPATGAGSRSKGLEDDLADPNWWLRPQESRAERCLRIGLQGGRFQLSKQHLLGTRLGRAQALIIEVGTQVMIMHFIDEDSNSQRFPLCHRLPLSDIPSHKGEGVSRET